MIAGRVAVAGVWWYEGLWCKVLGADGTQRKIVAAVPGMPASWVTPALVGIGAAEAGIGAWVLTGARPRLAALVQTGLLVAFNAGGLLFAGQRITRPGRMLTRNAALLAAVWLLPERRTPGRPDAARPGAERPPAEPRAVGPRAVERRAAGWVGRG